MPLEVPGHGFLRESGFFATFLQFRGQSTAAKRRALVLCGVNVHGIDHMQFA
ncbi:hypothetical protein [Dactylosporangium sp. NPDC006015]|uniref:hypothetical protein n=1 Tax=Dactylosporangium sp. NPDC006015 TaxID=3154576 RepID=UPI0033B7C58C